MIRYYQLPGVFNDVRLSFTFSSHPIPILTSGLPSTRFPTRIRCVKRRWVEVLVPYPWSFLLFRRSPFLLLRRRRRLRPVSFLPPFEVRPVSPRRLVLNLTTFPPLIFPWFLLPRYPLLPTTPLLIQFPFQRSPRLPLSPPPPLPPPPHYRVTFHFRPPSVWCRPRCLIRPPSLI